MTLKVCSAGILLKENKILLGKRSADLKFYPDVWDIIGGHCKNNETLEQTLSRELREEIGVTPTGFIHIAVFHDPKPNVHGDYEYNIYLVTDWIGSPRNLSPSEHSELGWFEINEALKLDLAHPKYPELFRSIEKNIGEKRHE
jgi:8-oxo-dGTP pyrophosphatase MutT (NUDIX family)